MDEIRDIPADNAKRVSHRRWLILLTKAFLVVVTAGIFAYYKPPMIYVARVKIAVDFDPKSSVLDKLGTHKKPKRRLAQDRPSIHHIK